MPKKDWKEEWKKEVARAAGVASKKERKTTLQRFTGISSQHQDSQVQGRLRGRRGSFLRELVLLEESLSPSEFGFSKAIESFLALEKTVLLCREKQESLLKKIRRVTSKKTFPTLFKPASWSRSG